MFNNCPPVKIKLFQLMIPPFSQCQVPRTSSSSQYCEGFHVRRSHEPTYRANPTSMICGTALGQHSMKETLYWECWMMNGTGFPKRQSIKQLSLTCGNADLALPTRAGLVTPVTNVGISSPLCFGGVVRLY